VSSAVHRVLPRTVAFWLLGGVFFVLLFAAGAPSPLYRVYQVEWGFSSSTLTAVFAVYAFALLVTLLFFGSLSDYLGRRRMIVVGLAVNAAACVSFLAADGVGLLFGGRALQGVATGVATGALGAALIELQPEESGRGPLVTSAAPSMGLAAGALATSALVQFAPAPTRLVWWLLLAACVVGIVAVLAMPDSAPRRTGVLASFRPRVSVPREARGAFVVALPCLVAVWALGGLYLSLGPSLAAELLGSQNRLWGGLVIFLLSGVGALAAVLFRGSDPARAMLVGCLALLGGVAVTFGAIATMTAAVFLIGTAVAGVGFGVAYLGAYRTVIRPAVPGDRAGLIAAIYIVNYLAFSIPALIAGIATSRVGIRETSLVYSASIAVLVAAVASSFLFRRGEAAPARGRIGSPPGPCTVPPPSAHCGRV
jgi:MFS family permease